MNWEIEARTIDAPGAEDILSTEIVATPEEIGPAVQRALLVLGYEQVVITETDDATCAMRTSPWNTLE